MPKFASIKQCYVFLTHVNYGKNIPSYQKITSSLRKENKFVFAWGDVVRRCDKTDLILYEYFSTKKKEWEVDDNLLAEKYV